MTERQKQFCNHYAMGLEKKAAAMAAGYSEKSAASAGTRLLRLKEVQAYLEKQRLPAKSAIADNGEILAFLTTVLRSNDETVAVRDKMRAAELLGKNLSLFSSENDGIAPVKIYGEGDIK